MNSRNYANMNIVKFIFYLSGEDIIVIKYFKVNICLDIFFGKGNIIRIILN